MSRSEQLNVVDARSVLRATRRAREKAYRTIPLRALWQHAPYFHDGSAATLADVVVHYNGVRGLGLTAEQQRDLVEYLKCSDSQAQPAFA